MPKGASLKPAKTGLTAWPWVVNVPAKVSESGKRERKYFKSEAKAKTFSQQEQTRIVNVRLAKSQPLLSPVQREVAQAIFRLMADKPPHAALDIIAAHLALEASREASVTVKAMFDRYEALLTRKTRKGRKISSSYKTQVKYTVPRFAGIHETKLPDLTRKAIEDCIVDAPPYARNGFLRVIGAALEFAKHEGLCKENVARGIKKSDTGELEVKILTPLQAGKLMAVTVRHDPEMVPAMALMLFAGIRPDKEMFRLQWSHIRLKDGVIFMPGDITKTGFQRYVEIEPNLAKWLAWHIATGGTDKGPVQPEILERKKKDKGKPLSSFENIRRRRRAIRAKAKINPWPSDAARHSYASYWMAIHRDEDKCRDNMGHRTKDELHKHYRKHVRESVAKRYWINPPKISPQGEIISK